MLSQNRRFERAVKNHKAERHARGFTSWGQFVAMLFCRLGRGHSVREICGGLACCEGKLTHPGIALAPKYLQLKSTFPYSFSNLIALLLRIHHQGVLCV